ncbi:SET domain-containing protein 4 [Macrosteles quadrilineatus]|uniref:SET domain-containing protein 4 n=1 Tax=Macrosteles quadrilineatus TaxID=74068 RepID=UPI0023E1026B|nr:SET domain-containing protein 4 [Macrosteles quadrilineatus]
MTVETASKSLFGWLFKRRRFLSQQVLAAHLALETHLGKESFWVKYIGSLPQNIATPVFTSSAEIDVLPIEVTSQVNSFKVNIGLLFQELVESFSPNDKCPHCDISVFKIFTFDSFIWAWFIINSRAVYICPERNSDHQLKLSDSNCLALAPYLDMFNHSNDAKVQAFVSEVDGHYRIQTSTPFRKNTQVFIHYGDHANLKLYLEYGFIISNNIHDTLQVTFDEVYSTIVCKNQETSTSKKTYSFLKSHDLLTNMYLSADGLSWSLKALIYVLLSSEKVDHKTIQLKVYSNSFTNNELGDIWKIGKLVLEKKRHQIQTQLQEMKHAKDYKLCSNVSGSFLMAIELYQEYLSVLGNCEKNAVGYS